MRTAIIFSIIVVFFSFFPGCQNKDDLSKQEIIKLRFSSYNFPTDIPNLQATHALDLVEKKTNGRVKIERYMGGALGGVLEELDLVSTGAVDIICLHLDQYPQQLPLHKILNAEQFVDNEQALANITALTKEIPETKRILEETYKTFETAGLGIVALSQEEVNKFWHEFARGATADWLENAEKQGVGDQAVAIQKYWDDMKWGKWTK